MKFENKTDINDIIKALNNIENAIEDSDKDDGKSKLFSKEQKQQEQTKAINKTINEIKKLLTDTKKDDTKNNKNINTLLKNISDSLKKQATLADLKTNISSLITNLENLEKTQESNAKALSSLADTISTKFSAFDKTLSNVNNQKESKSTSKQNTNTAKETSEKSTTNNTTTNNNTTNATKNVNNTKNIENNTTNNTTNKTYNITKTIEKKSEPRNDFDISSKFMSMTSRSKSSNNIIGAATDKTKERLVKAVIDISTKFDKLLGFSKSAGMMLDDVNDSMLARNRIEYEKFKLDKFGDRKDGSGGGFLKSMLSGGGSMVLSNILEHGLIGGIIKSVKDLIIKGISSLFGVIKNALLGLVKKLTAPIISSVKKMASNAISTIGKSFKGIGKTLGSMIGINLGGNDSNDIDIDLPDRDKKKSKRTKGRKRTKLTKIGKASNVSKIASKGGNLVSKAGSTAVKTGAKTLAKTGLKAAAKLGARAIPFVGTAAMALYDGISGWNDKELQQRAFGLKEGQEATFQQKTASALGNILDLGGLTSGAAQLLGINLQTEDLVKGMDTVIEGFKKFNPVSLVTGAWKKIGGFVYDIVKDIPEKFSKYFDTIKEGISNFIGNIKDKIVSFFTSIPEAFSKVTEGIKEFFLDPIGKVKEVISGFGEFIVNLPKMLIEKITSFFKDGVVGTVAGGVAKGFKAITNFFTGDDKKEESKNAAKDATKDIANQAKELGLPSHVKTTKTEVQDERIAAYKEQMEAELKETQEMYEQLKKAGVQSGTFVGGKLVSTKSGYDREYYKKKADKIKADIKKYTDQLDAAGKTSGKFVNGKLVNDNKAAVNNTKFGLSPDSSVNNFIKDNADKLKPLQDNRLWWMSQDAKGAAYGAGWEGGNFVRHDKLHFDQNGMVKMSNKLMYDCSQYVAALLTNMGEKGFVDKNGNALNSKGIANKILAKNGGMEKNWNDAKSGDVIYLDDNANGISHVAMLVQDPKTGQLMVTDSRGKKGVSNMSYEDYQKKYGHRMHVLNNTDDPSKIKQTAFSVKQQQYRYAQNRAFIGDQDKQQPVVINNVNDNKSIDNSSVSNGKGTANKETPIIAYNPVNVQVFYGGLYPRL